MPVSAEAEAAARAAAAVEVANPGGFGVYVHWPFCKAKCPYCDFNSHVRRQPVDQRRFLAALLRELDWFAERTAHETVASVFFGGGTPSLMQPETVAGVIEGISARWPMTPGAEITLEANPTSVEAGRFTGYREAGVNRVSLGVQALRNDALLKLGRQHTAAEALKAFDIARARFDRVSFDLIYARPGQSVEEWRVELGEALAIAVDHLSLYQLTIEPGTPFHDLHRRGRLAMPDDDLAATFYEATAEACGAAGLDPYEISNHARPGAECRHNLVYWRGGDWAAAGPGAHGRIGDGIGGPRRATSGEPNPERWLGLVETGGHGIVANETLCPSQAADELLLTGLRLTEGVDLARHAALGGRIDTAAVDGLVAAGLVQVGPDRLRLAPAGRLVANAVIAAVAG